MERFLTINLMELEKNVLITVLYKKEYLNKEKWLAENILMKILINMKVNWKMIRQMELVSVYILMEIFIKENLMIIIKKEMEY